MVNDIKDYSHQRLEHIDPNNLQPNPLQARSMVKSETLVDLVESIKAHGILEPLVVAKTPAGYQIIAGERRWRAAKIIGLSTVPVVIKETDSQGMLEMALVENVQREDLNPIEKAQGFKRLMDEFSLSVSEIAKRIGKSPSYVSNSIRLLALPDAIKDGLISGDITEGHARALVGLSDVKLMVEAYKKILAEGASVRRAEDLARKIKERTSETPKKSRVRIYSTELEGLAKDISDDIEARVRIRQSKVSATVQILFKGPPEKTTKAVRHFHQIFNRE